MCLTPDPHVAVCFAVAEASEAVHKDSRGKLPTVLSALLLASSLVARGALPVVLLGGSMASSFLARGGLPLLLPGEHASSLVARGELPVVLLSRGAWPVVLLPG